MVARTNRSDADLIIVTRDFIDGSVENRENDVAPLAGLRPYGGVYAIPGDYDYFLSYDATSTATLVIF